MRRPFARHSGQAPAAPEPWPPPLQTSALTAPLPRHVPHGRLWRITRRVVSGVLLGGALIALVVAVRSKLLGTTPLAMLLYQTHDSFYLPLKGYTFTRFFPGSLVWYGLIATLFLLWYTCYLADRSLVRRAHLALLRQTVSLGPLRSALLGVSRLLLRLGLPPELLREVAEHERDLATLRLAGGDDGAGPRLSTLTRLLVGVAALRPDDQHATLQAADAWQRAVCLLTARDHREAAALAPLILPACARALRKHGLTPIDALAGQAPGLGAVPCLTDAIRIALLTGADPASLGADHDPRLGAVTARSALTQGLLAAAEGRRAQVDSLRAALERAIARPFAQHADQGLSTMFADAAMDELPTLGRLALSAALMAAFALRSGDLAQGAVESLDALGLALALAGPVAPPALVEPARRARAWAGGLPTPADRQLTASLGLARITTLALAWQPFVAYDTPVRQADLALAEARSDDQFRAAGLGHDANLLDTAEDTHP